MNYETKSNEITYIYIEVPWVIVMTCIQVNTQRSSRIGPVAINPIYGYFKVQSEISISLRRLYCDNHNPKLNGISRLHN